MPYLTIEQIKSLNLDELIRLYSSGYRLDTNVLQTPTTTPTVTPTPSPTPIIPLLGVFLYPWFGGNPVISPTTIETWRHWRDLSNPPSTWFSNYLPTPFTDTFDPYNDLYSSKDINLIKWELSLLKKAGINFFISSWWGQNSYEDQALYTISQLLPTSINPYPDAKFCIYYELDGQGIDIPEAQIISDINYVLSTYSNNPNYLKINGKPVVFVYQIANNIIGYETDLQKAQKWYDAKNQIKIQTGIDIYMVLKVFTGYQSYTNLADSWHQYGPATGFEAQSPYSAYISPGFYKSGESSPRLVRDPSTFEQNVKQLANTNVQWKLIETWNEWGEGSGIEPAMPINPNVIPYTQAGPSYGNTYVDIVGKYFVPVPVSGGSMILIAGIGIVAGLYLFSQSQ